MQDNIFYPSGNFQNSRQQASGQHSISYKTVLFREGVKRPPTTTSTTTISPPPTTNPVTRVSDIMGWRLDLILQGNWSLHPLHKGPPLIRGGSLPAGGFTCAGFRSLALASAAARERKPPRQEGLSPSWRGGLLALGFSSSSGTQYHCADP